MQLLEAPVKDLQTVTADGKNMSRSIEGMNFKKLVIQADHRGELTEVYSENWGFHPKPLVYLYHVRARVGSIRGWVVHRKQDDRIYCVHGVLHWAFYDGRPDSPTYQQFSRYTFGSRNPTIFSIPSGVYHAVKNIGMEDADFINMPTRPYDHKDPDKYRLPIKNNLIPYDFSDV